MVSIWLFVWTCAGFSAVQDKVTCMPDTTSLEAGSNLTLLAKDYPYSYIPPVTIPVPPDSIDVVRLQHKAFWRATAETVGLNLVLGAFDRYVLDGPYSKISWHTIRENFRHGFVWDNDALVTNLFGHPYNGSFFFNAGRSNGYNFWQSSLFGVGGSLMWELFMENTYPSINDFIATPIGGAAFGEVLYRTSDMVLDDRSSGAERFGRETAAFLIDPMRGFTRIVTGRAWKKRATSGRRFGIPLVRLSFSLGSRILLFHDDRNYSRAGFTSRVNIEYGEKFADQTRYPYDYFTFLFDLDLMKTQPMVSKVEITGRLLSKEIYDSNTGHISVGMFQHFDYMDSDTISKSPSHALYECLVPYKLGVPASVGGGILMRHTQAPTWQIEGFVHLNAIALGGVLTDFYRNSKRNYNWGSGFSVKTGMHWFNKKIGLNAGVNFRLFQIYTIKGGQLEGEDYKDVFNPNIQGDKSNTTFMTLEAHCNVRLWKELYATAMFNWYFRRTHYLHLNNTDTEPGYLTRGSIFRSRQLGLKVMLTYNL